MISSVKMAKNNSETKLQSDCITWCKQNGFLAYNQHQGGFTGKGVPDILMCIHGRFVAVELKVGKGRRSPSQEIRKIQIERAGGIHITPYSFDEFTEAIRRLYDDLPH